jgi:hypothetical protein
MSRLETALTAVKTRRRLVAGGAIALVVVVAGAAMAIGGIANSGAAATPSQIVYSSNGLTPLPSITDQPTATPEATGTPAPTVSPSATPVPALPPVAATTDGVWIPAQYAFIATRRPIAVMIDDHWAARPQAGLSQADVVYQALAEGNIPRYMAIFQTQNPNLIGPIRSSRYYYVTWAEEYNAMYVHMWGAPNAMARLAQLNGTVVWNVDGLHFGTKTGAMWRVGFQRPPHNLYTSSDSMRGVLSRLGGATAVTGGNWTFMEGLPIQDRLQGGTISIPYYYDHINYVYDRATNTYPRTVQIQGAELDRGNFARVAPSNVVVMYQDTFALGGHANMKKHRLDIQTVGRGPAIVFNNGQMIRAVWSKKTEASITVITYASGPLAGQRVPMVRGQIFVQVVPSDMNVTWTLGTTVGPVPFGG